MLPNSEKQRRKELIEQKKKEDFVEKNSSVTLYPPLHAVLEDVTLACYFRPLMTYLYKINNKEYKIHLFGTDGLFCVKVNKYAESNFFGFQYNNGVYKFLGNIETFFEYDKIPSLYKFLKDDFEDKKDNYLINKIKIKDYINSLHQHLNKFNFLNLKNAEYYVEAFYSYEFTKYNYEQIGVYKHISVITENYGENNDNFLLKEKDALNILEEFFINIEYHLKNDYGINEKMFCCATDRHRFMSMNGGICFGLLDQQKENIYLLEYI